MTDADRVWIDREALRLYAAWCNIGHGEASFPSGPAVLREALRRGFQRAAGFPDGPAADLERASLLHE